MSKRTPWTRAQIDEFESWHELIVASYPDDVAKELRQTRRKFMARVPIDTSHQPKLRTRSLESQLKS